MRFTVFTAIAAMTCVHAIPHLDERGTYEMDVSVGVNYNYPTTDAAPAPEYTPPAQYDTPPMPYSTPSMPEPPTPAASAAAPGGTQYVVVGGEAGLVYTPECIFAEIGEVIIFHFSTKNHTLTQSTFPQPCNAMAGGMDSGFKPFPGTGDMPSFQMTVTTTTPQWFYCQQTNHCKMGMVFAINPPTTGDKTFQAYKNLAMGTATVIQTVNTATTVSVTAPPPPPPPPPPAATMIPGYNVATDGQCQCVCNIDLGNGAANPAVQGLGVFGGQVGNVQAPWMMYTAAAPPAPPAPSGPPAPPASAAAPPSPPPAYTAAAYGAVGSPDASTADASTVGGFSTLNQGTVIALGAPPAVTPSATAAADTAPPAGTLAVDPSPAATGGYTADGVLGGAAGK